MARLEALLESDASDAPDTVWDNVREFEEIRLPNRGELVRSLPEEEEHGAGEMLVWESVLHPAPARVEALRHRTEDQIFEKWTALVEDLGGEVRADYRRLVGGLTFVPVALPVEAIEEAIAFNPLRAIRPMPKLRPISVGVLRQVAGTAPEPSSATAPLSELRIGVFDGGIDPDCPYVAPFVTSYEPSSEPANADLVMHGSVVTNTVLYGGTSQGQLPEPEVGVDHHRVLPVPSEHADVDLNWILDRIVEAVHQHRYPVVNLSLGPDIPVDDDEPHRWTAELDALTLQVGTLFVVAAGNNGEADEFLGLNRVQVPSDMANGVGIGAVETRDRTSWNRASYSAVGPGRYGGRVQPVGVSFGGSAAEPFRGISLNGTLVESMGTSFAAPLVTHALGGGLATIRDASPQLLRALVAHSAERRSRHHSMVEHGYGRIPERLDELFECPPHRVTVVYQDVLQRDELVAFEIPFADGIASDERIQLKWTLAFPAPVDPTDAVDYTLAGVETVFRPHSRIHSLSKPGTSQRSIVLNIDDEYDRVMDLLDEGYQPSTHPVSHPTTTFRTEQNLRESGKWEALLQQRVSRKASQLSAPRIDLKYLARAGGQLQRDDVDDLPVALIVSLTAPRAVDLYDRTRAEFGVLAPLVTRAFVRVRT